MASSVDLGAKLEGVVAKLVSKAGTIPRAK